MITRLIRSLTVIPGITMLFACFAYALDDGQSLTPPMGWNSWNWFGCHGFSTESDPRDDITETLIKSIADAFITSGMADAGYRYINIDDCWGEYSRNTSGGLVAAVGQFPGGMKALSEYVHSKGLKLGIYSDLDKLTCSQSMPGAMGHEQQDADTFVAWGIDYLKYDYCGGPYGAPSKLTADSAYSLMGHCLKKAVEKAKTAGKTDARDVVYSICNWGFNNPWLWADTIGHLWRTTLDIRDVWEGATPGGWGLSVMAILDQVDTLWKYAKPGAWNDPDMLEVGNNSLTAVENQSHFALWCIMAAPLIAGNDVRDMTASTKAILTNKEVIAVDQDSLGLQGRRIWKSGTQELWAKKLLSHDNPDYAVVLFNRGSAAATITFHLDSLKKFDANFDPSLSYYTRDLIAKSDLPPITGGTFTATSIPAHGVRMIRISADSMLAVKKNTVTRGARGIMARFDGNKLVVENTRNNPVSISITDLKGAVIFKRLIPGNSSNSLLTSSLKAGPCFVSARSGHDIFCKKMMVLPR